MQAAKQSINSHQCLDLHIGSHGCVEFVVFGEPASKANSRRIVLRGKRPVSIKSAKALNYVDIFASQCPQLRPLLEGDLFVEITIYYASRRPDLDESLILDGMQGRIYVNDRQVKSKFIEWGLDTSNPRAIIRVGPRGSAAAPDSQRAPDANG
jgi:Holliday junction resolvase RusA-like endonuclease